MATGQWVAIAGHCRAVAVYLYSVAVSADSTELPDDDFPAFVNLGLHKVSPQAQDAPPLFGILGAVVHALDALD